MTKRTAAALIAILALGFGSFLRPVPAVSRPADGPAGDVFLFVLLEADSFLCSPCLSRTLALCRAARSDNGHVHLGVLVLYRPPKVPGNEEPYRRMVARRAQSVFQANGLTCPVMIDDARQWEAFSSRGTELLVLDGRTHAVRGFALPLEPAALKTILQNPEQGGNDRE